MGLHKIRLQKLIAAMFLLALLLVQSGTSLLNTANAQSVRPPDNAVNQPEQERIGTSNTLGPNSQSDYWRALRHGKGGLSTSGQAGSRLIQSQGEDWRLIRKQYIIKYSGWLLAGVLGLLVLFFVLRGRIRLKGGRSGKTISRFSLAHRTAHWFMASVFIMLGLSGLIILLGRSVLAPLIGKTAHAIITSAAMQGHNLFGPLFIIALLWLFYLFVPGNFFKLVDLKWLAKGGGLIGGHASAGHYNFGEKVWFWVVGIAGLLISITGMLLEFPWLVTDMQLLQLSTIVHAIAAVGLIAFAFGHIYIGTIGMEGALDSMTTGDVDVNWAKEHHDLWYEEVTGETVAQSDEPTDSDASGHAQVYTQSR